MSERAESPYYPNPERPSRVSNEVLDVFDNDPELILPPEELNKAMAFEEMLTIGEDLGSGPEKAVGIEKIWMRKINTSIFFPEFFLTPEGRQGLVDHLGASLEEINFTDLDEAKKWLMGFDYSNVSGESVKKLQGDSIKHVDKKMLDQFAHADYESVEDVDNPLKIDVVRNPLELAKKISEYKTLKIFHKEVARDLKNKTDDLSKTKLVLLDIHRKKLNELIAFSYIDAVSLARHEGVISTPNGKEALSMINTAIGYPLVSSMSVEDGEGYRAISKMNNFIDGVGGTNDSGDFTVLGKDALDLADQLDAQDEQGEKVASTVVSSLEISPDKLATIRVDAEEIQIWYQKILSHWNILSNQQEYDPDRQGRAKDGLWQAVLDEAATSLSVNSKQGIIRIPVKYNEFIGSPGGAVADLDHELAHVAQHETKRQLGLAITQNVGTQRAGLNFEGGATAWEEQGMKEFFGLEIPAESFYLRAIQEKLKGGSYKECVKAFLDSMLIQNPDGDKKEYTEHAIDRTRRIFRRNGVLDSKEVFLTNSKQLIYLEQELLARELEKRGRENLMMVGGTNIETLAELHKIGLFTEDRVKLPKMRPSNMIKKLIVAKLLNI